MKKTSLTNVLLGIIVFCLLVNLCVQFGLIPKANAGTPFLPQAPTKVIVVGVASNDMSVPFGQRISGDAVPVKIVNNQDNQN